MAENFAIPDYLIWAYRLLLGREPEDFAAVQRSSFTTRKEIVDAFMRSEEFIGQHSSLSWITENQWFMSELANGVRFWLRTNDEYISRAIIQGNYEPIETAFVRRHVSRGMNVVDAGANLGWYTANMAMLVGPSGRVHAFEPRKDLAYHLRRTIAENKLQNVSVHEYALSANDGSGLITYDRDDRNPGGTNLIIDNAIADRAVTTPVDVRKLDGVVWNTVHFIKLDVEGAEKLVLEGAELILNRDRPIILSEINEECLRRTSKITAPEYLHMLDDLEYTVRRILPGGRCGDRISADDVYNSSGILNVACFPRERDIELITKTKDNRV